MDIHAIGAVIGWHLLAAVKVINMFYLKMNIVNRKEETVEEVFDWKLFNFCLFVF